MALSRKDLSPKRRLVCGHIAQTNSQQERRSSMCLKAFLLQQTTFSTTFGLGATECLFSPRHLRVVTCWESESLSALAEISAVSKWLRATRAPTGQWGPTMRSCRTAMMRRTMSWTWARTRRRRSRCRGPRLPPWKLDQVVRHAIALDDCYKLLNGTHFLDVLGQHYSWNVPIWLCL